MKAIYLCNKEKTEMLLNAENIDLTISDKNSRTALHMTCWGDGGG